MTDIVERLQVHAGIMTRDKGKWVRFIDGADCLEAAATITELRATALTLLTELEKSDRRNCKAVGKARAALEGKDTI